MTASQPARKPGRPRLLDGPMAPTPPRVGWQDGTLAGSWDCTAEAWEALAQLAERQAAQARAQAEYLRCTPTTSGSPADPRWATVDEAAVHCHVSRETIYRWAKASDGSVRRIRPLDGLRISLADLDRWVAETDR